MNTIINFISNINLCLLSMIIVVFILSLLFLFRKKVSDKVLNIYIIMYVIFSWIVIYYFNDIINSIFSLNYFDIRSYLLLLVIVNIITIININFIKNIYYKVLNYTMFITNVIVLLANIFTLLGSRLGVIKLIGNEISNMININYIIFFLYLDILLYSRLVLFIINKRKKENINVLTGNSYEPFLDNKGDLGLFDNKDINRPVLSNNVSDGFVIDGIDCSAIFDIGNKKEILENYYILLNDIDAKLTNGYTIKEYNKIKSIINRLNISDINNINLDIKKLSLINIDEYNLLKSYLSSKNIKM